MITARDTLGIPDTITLGSVVLRAFAIWQTREKRSQTRTSVSIANKGRVCVHWELQREYALKYGRYDNKQSRHFAYLQSKIGPVFVDAIRREFCTPALALFRWQHT